MSRTRANIVAGGAAVLLALALPLAFALPAAAHSQVVSTNPADGSTVTELPAEISVTANEDLADLTGTGQGFALLLVGPDGAEHPTTPISIDGPTVSAPAPADLPAGEYEMRYQIVSADTHPVSGSIRFTYDPSGEGAIGPTDGATDQPAAGEGVPIAAWLVPLAVVIVIAAIVWIVLARRRRP